VAADSTTPRAPHRGRSPPRAPDADMQEGNGHGALPEDTKHPKWEERPDGSRTRKVNGIRIVDRTTAADPRPGIEHLVAEHDEGGRVRIVGLDADCRPVYVTTLFGYL
jgi:hypothetical protein